MNGLRNRPTTRILASVLVFSVFILSNVSCMGGNWNLARKVVKWNLGFSVIPRVLIYIILIIIPVYPIAALLDLIIFNTIEFWTKSPVITAKVNQSFEKDGAKVDIVHEANPLRHTTITTTEKSGKVTVSELRETEKGTIEVYVDGKKNAELQSIDELNVKLVRFSTGTTQLLDVSRVGELPNDRIAENRARVAETVWIAPEQTVACSKPAPAAL